MPEVAEDGATVTHDNRELEPNEFHVADVPLGRAIRLGDVAVFNVGGRLLGTQAQCTHMGGPLCEGKLDGSVVTCPFHGAQFDVATGMVLRGPAQQQLQLYAVRVTDGIGSIDVEFDE